MLLKRRIENKTLLERNINITDKIPKDYEKPKLLTEIMKYDKIHEFDMGVDITASVISEILGN